MYQLVFLGISQLIGWLENMECWNSLDQPEHTYFCDSWRHVIYLLHIDLDHDTNKCSSALIIIADNCITSCLATLMSGAADPLALLLA